MAISKTIVLSSGLTVENAYIRISNIEGNKDSLVFEIRGYASQQAYLDGKSYLDYKKYSFVPSQSSISDRWDKQAYEYLKTLDKYIGAVDVLEEGQTL